MATGRNPKRARKKDRRAARREEYMREYLRRRRQRRFVLLGTLVVLLAIGAVAFFFLKPSKKHAAASPSPTPVPTPCVPKQSHISGTDKPQFSCPADQHLDPKKNYTWRLVTDDGTIDIALDVKRAPKTANSIVFLTRQHFYDGLFFHRNVKDFVIQGGDPLGTGTGGSGYKVVEAPPSDLKYDVGVVAMAKGGNEAPGTSGSQFFIMVGTSSPLPPEYALVGKVTSGMDVAQQIVNDAPGEPPTVKVHIQTATIIES
jgi:peptidyl-prolyl cis-trans isomerase B (cyclophilin B)